ncbi:hypothetical protein Pmani_007317 [Petrolisthes manimaculis]|uniref:ZSWIM3 N-terminal domain-containing protein n=1 Tax=Petrolisthes manimaculis TaxID=1843537 RepID=A0AAE1Q7U0_9EUCA|nr:hypothetical protein Pmani_007317 [Petrolisthes manimaculis]
MSFPKSSSIFPFPVDIHVLYTCLLRGETKMQELDMVEGAEVENVVEVVESTWMVTKEEKEGEIQLESSVTESEQSYVVDFTPQFDRIFVQTTFNSFREFEEVFNKFKAETGTVFRIKSSCSVAYENSRRKRHFVPARFKFVSVRYCCVHYGQPKIAGQGIRSKQRYLPCGCECMLSLSYNRGALVISQAAMQHNHEVNSQMAPYYAINRRISNSELRQVAGMIESMPSSRALQQFLQRQFHRHTTLQDAKNIRARLKALKMHQEASSRAVKSIKVKPEIIEKVYKKDDNEGREETDDKDIEDTYREYEYDEDEGEIENEIMAENDECEELTNEEQSHNQQQTGIEKRELREAVTSNLQAKLSDLLRNCETSVFLSRVSIMNKIINCWENGVHVDLHHRAGDDDEELDQVTKICAQLSELSKTSTQPVPNVSALEGSSETCATLMIQEFDNTSVNLVPSEVNGGGPLEISVFQEKLNWSLLNTMRWMFLKSITIRIKLECGVFGSEVFVKMILWTTLAYHSGLGL